MTTKVYFVTCIETKIDKEIGKETSHSSRCWGYYFDLDLAKEHVRQNVTDIWEYCYTWAVIEDVPMGILPIGTKEVAWFKFNHETKQYEECAKPAFSKGIVHWGIG